MALDIESAFCTIAAMDTLASRTRQPASPETIADLFQALGGPGEIGEALAVSRNTAASWRFRRSVPVEHWIGLISFAGSKGVSIDADALLAIHQNSIAPSVDDAPRDSFGENPALLPNSSITPPELLQNSSQTPPAAEAPAVRGVPAPAGEPVASVVRDGLRPGGPD